MTNQHVRDSAAKLSSPSLETAMEFEAKSMLVAEEVSRRLGLRADIDRLVGPGNLTMMNENHRNHARFMTSLFHDYEPEVLVETVLWVFRAYIAHGFRLAYWPAQLDTWVEILKDKLSEKAFAEIYPIYHWLIVNQPVFVELSRSHVPDDTYGNADKAGRP